MFRDLHVFSLILLSEIAIISGWVLTVCRISCNKDRFLPRLRMLRWNTENPFCFAASLNSLRIAYTATIFWDNIPTHLKYLNAFNPSKQLKFYLLPEQHSENLYWFSPFYQTSWAHLFSWEFYKLSISVEILK